MDRFKTFEEFWPFYLNEHSKPQNRLLHFIGSSLGIVFLITAVVTMKPLFILAALFVGYLFAWVGHFFIEKNRPATFKYPLWSFLGDWKMWYWTITGKINSYYEKK